MPSKKIIGWALMNDEGMFFESLKEKRSWFKLIFKPDKCKWTETHWLSLPNLRNEMAKEIYLIPSQLKLAKLGVLTHLIKFEARHGVARRGEARRGEARLGKARN